MEGIEKLQQDEPNPWVIRQKQGGSDEICIGGTLECKRPWQGAGHETDC